MLCCSAVTRWQCLPMPRPPGAARALAKPLVSLCSSGACGTSLTSTAGGLALEDLTGRRQEVQGQPMSATTGDRQSEIEHCLALKAPRNEVGIAQDVQVKDCSAPLSVGTSKSHHFIPCAATCCLFLGARVIPSQIHEDHEATMSTYPRPSASPSSKIRLVMVTDGHGLILVIDSVNVRLVMALVADPCALCPCARPKDQISMTSIDKLRRLRSFGI